MNQRAVVKELQKVVVNTMPPERGVAEPMVEIPSRAYQYTTVDGLGIVVPKNEVWVDVSFYVYAGIGAAGYLFLEYRPPETTVGGGQFMRINMQTPAAVAAQSNHVFTDSITVPVDVDFLGSATHFYQIVIPKMRHLPGTYWEMTLQGGGGFEMLLTYTKYQYDVVRI